MLPWDDPIAKGDLIVNLIQDDWDVFSERLLLKEGQAKKLLQKIARACWDDDDGEPPFDVHELYTRRPSVYHETLDDKWKQFCYEVMKDSEGASIDLWSDDLARAERVLKKGNILYRARIGFNATGEPYSGNAIGAPPPEKALIGRANRKGKVVLYCADAEQTAVAETRPWRGLLVSVGRVRTKDDVRILDVTQTHRAPNPFTSEYLRWEVEQMDLLHSFALELGKPLSRKDDPADYVPCQKLAEFAEASHFDGIRYPSAIAPAGTNVVMFNPCRFEILTPSRLVRVANVEIKYEELDDDLGDE